MRKVLLIIGIILICLGALSIFGDVMTGGFSEMLANVGTARGNGVIVGFFLPDVVGIILILVGCKKKKE